ncbi:hypothetical protein O9929_23500 [Vibrio lentus]|nr:hypothetical protein [Vibrio lentus]
MLVDQDAVDQFLQLLDIGRIFGSLFVSLEIRAVGMDAGLSWKCHSFNRV